MVNTSVCSRDCSDSDPLDSRYVAPPSKPPNRPGCIHIAPFRFGLAATEERLPPNRSRKCRCRRGCGRCRRRCRHHRKCNSCGTNHERGEEIAGAGRWGEGEGWCDWCPPLWTQRGTRGAAGGAEKGFHSGGEEEDNQVIGGFHVAGVSIISRSGNGAVLKGTREQRSHE